MLISAVCVSQEKVRRLSFSLPMRGNCPSLEPMYRKQLQFYCKGHKLIKVTCTQIIPMITKQYKLAKLICIGIRAVNFLQFRRQDRIRKLLSKENKHEHSTQHMAHSSQQRVSWGRFDCWFDEKKSKPHIYRKMIRRSWTALAYLNTKLPFNAKDTFHNKHIRKYTRKLYNGYLLLL